ncbi:hypothetical protein D3C73_1281340 [compost metagenome]
MEQAVVIVRPRLVEVVQIGHIRIVKNIRQLRDRPAGPQRQLAAAQYPAALVFVRIFPFLRISRSRPGLHVVVPHILRAGAVGPGVLTGDRAGMAADALVEVHHHRDLCFNPQANLPPSADG